MGVRDELVEEVKRYFVGPYREDESLRDYPEELYVSGLLFPKNSVQEQEDMEEMQAGTASDEDSSHAEENIRNHAWLLQNSIGIKCNMKPDVKDVKVQVEYARYSSDSDPSDGCTLWNRHSSGIREFTINIDDTEREIKITDEDGEMESKIMWDVSHDGRDPPKYVAISVFLSNEMNRPGDVDESGTKRKYREKKILKNHRIIFQPSIRIHADGREIFLGSDVESENFLTGSEDESLDLLFRNSQVFAQGYNCSASWDSDCGSPRSVRTEIIPVYDSKRIQFSSEDDPERPGEIDMVKIDQADTPEELRELLEPLSTKYDSWIGRLAEKEESLKNEPEIRTRIAQQNRQKCGNALKRIREGMELLGDGSHPEIFEAFKIANRAMLYQRVRYDFAIERSKGRHGASTPNVFKEGKSFWRPFQMAFLLMSLRGIGDVESDEGLRQREMVDLLWFPTGGGKTEAYLGLAAFVMVLRRLRGMDEGHQGLGVSVIMRYTLRLLTLQQFERAATLICALEKIRRDDRRLGTEPFLIGLWVGYSLTPNSWEKAKKAIEKLARGELPESGSPAQLNFCPWCGADIKCDRFRNDYHVDDRRTLWTLVHCPDARCDFYSPKPDDVRRALPVVMVDDDIYRRCPSLLIATVDKFARLPWNAETGSLFGIVNRKCPRHGFFDPSSEHEGSHRGVKKEIVENVDRLNGPDMIIQDELHLITGPLGTMVGLYETAVDHLISFCADGIGPKIIVSTATIKGVEEQVKKLYNRKKLETFPPPAIDYGDSFFWWHSDEPGRRYVGLSYSHKSMKFALGRLYSSLLQKVFELKGTVPDAELDPYWTVVAYFNSTRELGGAIRLVEDDVKSNIRKMKSLIDSHSDFGERQLRGPEEITGRRTGNDIKELRKRLELDMGSVDSIDILLATSMISVGIDINRLGLMVVNGQTKNISEYIQATGRIGRRFDNPGLVLTLYNPYKPRDLSHYENFMGTHATLQKSVEPVGVTPFSDKAMERAIHAVLIALIRLMIENLSRNREADAFDRKDPRIERLVQAIFKRYVSVQNLGESSPDYKNAEFILNRFLDNWKQFLEKNHSKGKSVFYMDDDKYASRSSGVKKEKVIMTDFAENESTGREWSFLKETPSSLRDVETEAKLFYV